MSDPETFTCAMCGGVFPVGDDDEARREAEAKDINLSESAAVCDDCYRVTPWGDAPDEAAARRRFALGRHRHGRTRRR
jgi:hypothetical protein